MHSRKKLRFTLLALIVGANLAGSSLWAVPSGTQMSDAICDGSLDSVKSLLSQGYGINQPVAESGVTPLGLASYCYGGKPDIAAYLLSRGADVNRHEQKGYSNLMWALRSVDKEGDEMHKVAWTMIRKGANLNFQDPVTGRTALMIAASNGDDAMVKYLLDRGASKSLKTKGDWCISGSMTSCSAADYARLGGHVQLALKIEGKDPKEYERTLHYAVKQKDVARIGALLSQKVNVNEAEQLSKLTPLHYAVEVDSPEIIRMLLAAGAQPSSADYSGVTPLRNAIVFYKKQSALALIEGGARGDVEQQQGCGGGLTEFGWAVSYGQYDIAEILITKNRVDLQGGWSLFRSVDGRNKRTLEIAKMLISRGAKPPEDYISRLEMWAEKYNYEYALQIAQLVRSQANNNTNTADTTTDNSNESEVPVIPAEELEWVFIDRNMQRNLSVKQRSVNPETQKRIEISRRSVDATGKVDRRGDLPPR